MRAVFFGSSSFAVPALEALTREHQVAAVYTQPDRPAGRHLNVRPTPVKSAALALGLDVFHPEKLDSAFVSLVEGLHADVTVCAAYGRILPRALLDIASMPALNIHPSVLPRYRGAAPIQAALRDGCAETGITIFWMSAEMDAGDVALTRLVAIDPRDDYGSLSRRLAELAARLLLDALRLLSENNLPRVPQDPSLATYARPIKPADRELRFDRSAMELVNLVRSLSPKPGAWMTFAGKRLKVLAARAAAAPSGALTTAPGTMLPGNGAQEPLIACAEGALALVRVVPEGRAATSGVEFARGLHQRRSH